MINVPRRQGLKIDYFIISQSFAKTVPINPMFMKKKRHFYGKRWVVGGICRKWRSQH
jgi:hypothetical protein